MKLGLWLLPAAGITLLGTILAAALPNPPSLPARSTPAPPAKPAPVTAAPAAGDPAPPAVAPQAAPQVAPPMATAVIGDPRLDQIVAPIALYPDQLLGQILMASTYPLGVVEAARWIGVPANRALTGEALTSALRDKHWDPSVMALAAFPGVLEIMGDRAEWTRRLGRAFIANQAELLDAVQRLRRRAMAAGNLKTGAQCQCVVAADGGGVTVSPANPAVVYVPIYDPALVYGAWPYPLNPPVALAFPDGFAFAPGVFIGFGAGTPVAHYGSLWGWGRVDWAGHRIIVDARRYNAVATGASHFAGGVWAHDPAHRTAMASKTTRTSARSAVRVAASGHGRRVSVGRFAGYLVPPPPGYPGVAPTGGLYQPMGGGPTNLAMRAPFGREFGGYR